MWNGNTSPPLYNLQYTTASGGDRGIVYRASTILLTDIQEEQTMLNTKTNRLFANIVDDYYNEANYNLGVK